MNKFKKGDIYHWRYKDPNKTYWCESRIAIIDNDLCLVDTYWYSDRKRLNNNDVELTFIANFDELESIDEHEIPFYSYNDVVNLSHSNNRPNGNIYKRKGAIKQRDIYLLSISTRLDEIEDEIERLRSMSDRIKEEMKIDELSYNECYKAKYSHYEKDSRLVWYKDRYYQVSDDNFVYSSPRLSEIEKQEIIDGR